MEKLFFCLVSGEFIFGYDHPFQFSRLNFPPFLTELRPVPHSAGRTGTLRECTCRRIGLPTLPVRQASITVERPLRCWMGESIRVFLLSRQLAEYPTRVPRPCQYPFYSASFGIGLVSVYFSFSSIHLYFVCRFSFFSELKCLSRECFVNFSDPCGNISFVCLCVPVPSSYYALLIFPVDYCGLEGPLRIEIWW